MRFWDSSAVVPLVFSEPTSESVNGLLPEDGDLTVWWGTWAECAATISRLRREGSPDEGSGKETCVALDNLTASWMEIEPTSVLRLLASLLSQILPLKTADNLRLAAALRWCGWDTSGAAFVRLDARLRRAAQDEGFDVPPEEEAVGR